MKKITLLLTILFSVTTFSQNTFPTNGNVGIGTNTPSATLDINSPPLVGDETLLKLKVSDASQDYLKISNSTQANSQFIPNLYGYHVSDNRQALYLTGAVGLSNDIGFEPIMIFDSRLTNNAVTNRPLFAWESYGNRKMVLNANGNVGIGTINPSGKLEITGNSGIYSDFAGYSGTTINNYLPNGKEPTLVISEKLDGSFTPNVDGQTTYRGGISFGRGGPGIYSINPNPAGSGFYGEIRFHTTYWNGSNYNNSDRMVIKLDGNVGIGTNSPDEKLTVKGKIHTQEVRVDMLGALVPDYVFANDYKLKTLQEVEAYIKQNNHLPEMPSAQEIEKNGLMLAEMNMALLKKMEEMTLYMIEQNKSIEILKKEIDNINCKK